MLACSIVLCLYPACLPGTNLATLVAKRLSERSCGNAAASEVVPCLLTHCAVAMLLPQHIASCLLMRHVLVETVLCSQHVHHVHRHQAVHTFLQQAKRVQLMTF